MSLVAIVGGKPAKASETGQRARCLDPRCDAEMIARVGQHVAPHWAHAAGQSCALDDRGEQGWHLTWRTLFERAGARTEVRYDGHRADVVLADGRVVEIQTAQLSHDVINSREATYGDMAWIYRVLTDDIDITSDTSTMVRVSAAPRKALLTHQRPVFWHLPDERVARVNAVANEGDTLDTGTPVWTVWLQVVAADWLEFVERIVAGEQFGPPPEIVGLWLQGRQRKTALLSAGLAVVTPIDDLDLDAIDAWCDRHRLRAVGRRRGQLVVTNVDQDIVARLRATCRKCSQCGKPMVAGQRDHHHGCDPTLEPFCTCHPNEHYRQWIATNVTPIVPDADMPKPCPIHGTIGAAA